MMSSASPTPAAFGLSAIGQIALSIGDLERAVSFYRDALGMKLLFQVSGMAFFECGGIRLMLSGSENQSGTYSSIVYFKVPDIRQAFETMQARGVSFDQEPHLVAPMPDHDLWMAFFRDPDRNLLALMSEVPRA
jgi:methylmalonyl-CoA/ethylmalonyl-CoA epimerase